MLSKEKLWSDSERLMLVRISREMLPELSRFMRRPLEEVQAKYEQLQGIFKRLYGEKAKR